MMALKNGKKGICVVGEDPVYGHIVSSCLCKENSYDRNYWYKCVHWIADQLDGTKASW